MSSYYKLNYEQFLPADYNAAIIDVGCGTGDFVRYVHQLGYRNILAVDIDQHALSEISELTGVTKLCAHVDAAFFMKSDRKFDLIVMKQVIYYHDRGSVIHLLDAVRERLSESGVLIVEIFNGALVSARFTEVKDPGIRTAYSELSLPRLLIQAGFSVESVFGFKQTVGSMRGCLYQWLKKAIFAAWRVILILERGRDEELPKIFAKTIIAVARRAR